MTTITPETQPLLLTVKRTAELLSIQPRSVRRWVKDGQLPSVRLPSGGIRIPADAVTSILRSHSDDADA